MSSEAFPDAHHKMSKKIAQLTKVIFHLHTKNEENDTYNKAVSNAYEVEIEKIVKQANSIIGQHKAIIEKQKEASNAGAKIKSIEEKHDEEKRKSQQEFGDFKKKNGRKRITVTEGLHCQARKLQA